MRTILITAAALLLAASTALAGGWATVELSSAPDQSGGGTWRVDMTILQHGVTPLEDVEPVVSISDGSSAREFPAAPTGRPGIYRAEVVFPHEGRWSYTIWDGFSQQHTYPPVEIGAAPAGTAPGRAPGDGGSPWLPLALAIAAGMAAAGLALRFQRRRPVRQV